MGLGAGGACFVLIDFEQSDYLYVSGFESEAFL
jgi:hypothetical protein